MKKAIKISLKEVTQTIKESMVGIKKTSLFIFYPIFLLYAFTLIGLAKFIQLIF